MFRALLVPLQPNSPSIPSGVLQVNYDAILPSSRRPLARSIASCRKAMQGIRDDLQAWKTRGSGGSGVGEGVAGEVGLGGLIGDMQREVLLIAVTPTEQEMRSSVGREVRLSDHPVIVLTNRRNVQSRSTQEPSSQHQHHLRQACRSIPRETPSPHFYPTYHPFLPSKQSTSKSILFIVTA